MEEITQAHLNRLTLAKHGLLSRSPDGSVAWAGRLCGLHAQLATTPALSLLARLRDFRRERVEELLRRKRLVKRWLMRGTLHVIPTKDLSLYHQAFRGAWRSSLGRFLDRQGLPPREVRFGKIYPAVLEVLRAGPLPRQDLEARIRELLPPDLGEQVGFTGWGGSLKEMAYEGLLVHTPSAGAEVPLASVEQWLPDVDLGSVVEDGALRELAARYFAAYGPATGQDLVAWSGIPAAALRPALQALKGELVKVSVVGQKGQLWTPRKDMTLLRRMVDAEAPPRFLPRYDVIILAYRDRSRLLESIFLRRVVSPTGQMEAIFMVDGRVAGTWGTARRAKDLIVTLRPFRPLAPAVVPQLRDEAGTLTDFYGAQGTKLLIKRA